MTEHILPELVHLRALLASLPPKGGSENTATVVVPLYANIIAEEDEFSALLSLYTSIDSLVELVEIKFPERGRKAAALAAIESIKALFSPRSLGRPYNEFAAVLKNKTSQILSFLPILEDIEFDSDSLTVNKANIFTEIEAARDRLASNSDLSDGSRRFLNAQFILMEKALVRFEKDGVGNFSASVYSAIGRIYIELRDEDHTKSGVKDVIDDVLRIHGLMQAGGDILKLSGPFIAGLLSAPVL